MTGRRIFGRTDIRAPLSAPYASNWLAGFYAEQQRAALQKMRDHDRLPPQIRMLDTIAGNDRVARLLAQAGVKTAAEAEARVRAMLEKLPKPERHVR